MERTSAPDSRDPEVLLLPPDGTAAGVARRQAQRLLGKWSLGQIREPLSLVVSELVGNAVRHGRPPFVLLLRKVRAGVRVDVHDESPQSRPSLPAPPPAHDQDAENGRGIGIVQSLSTATGIDQVPDDGKTVWAVVEPPTASGAG